MTSALDRVETLAPHGAAPLADFLASARASAAAPFAPSRADDVAAFGQALIRDPELRGDAATVAAAYWMRRAEIERIAGRFREESSKRAGEVRVAAGCVFHVAPSNVDTLFLYGWALAHLCGNASVVRLSQRRGALVARILAAFDGAAASRPDLARANRFVTYEHDAETSGALSAWCDQRVLWGGDDTVAAMRAVPLNPHAAERAFASKFSVAVFGAAAYAALDAASRAQLASDFFNDLFWFDQAACSSPQVAFWVGTEDAAVRAARLFHDELDAEVTRRGHVVSDALAGGRAVHAFRMAMRADVAVEFGRAGFVTAKVRGPLGAERETASGGLLRYAVVESLDDVAAALGRTDQTVTHFGIDAASLASFAAAAGARGVDRIVPVGRALAFEPVWDGFNLVDDFTRRVRLAV